LTLKINARAPIFSNLRRFFEKRFAARQNRKAASTLTPIYPPSGRHAAVVTTVKIGKIARHCL
jgi:hypothetical protein